MIAFVLWIISPIDFYRAYILSWAFYSISIRFRSFSDCSCSNFCYIALVLSASSALIFSSYLRWISSALASRSRFSSLILRTIAAHSWIFFQSSGPFLFTGCCSGTVWGAGDRFFSFLISFSSKFLCCSMSYFENSISPLMFFVFLAFLSPAEGSRSYNSS